MPAHARTEQSVCVVLDAPNETDVDPFEIQIDILDPTGEYFVELDELLPSNTPFTDHAQAFVEWVYDHQPAATTVTTHIQTFTFTASRLASFIYSYAPPCLGVTVKEVVRPWSN